MVVIEEFCSVATHPSGTWHGVGKSCTSPVAVFFAVTTCCAHIVPGEDFQQFQRVRVVGSIVKGEGQVPRVGSTDQSAPVELRRGCHGAVASAGNCGRARGSGTSR